MSQNKKRIQSNRKSKRACAVTDASTPHPRASGALPHSLACVSGGRVHGKGRIVCGVGYAGGVWCWECVVFVWGVLDVCM